MTTAVPASAQSTPGAYSEAYQARRDSLIAFYAHRVPATDLSAGGYFEIAARLTRGEDMDWVLARIDSVLAKPPSGDMFWMFPFVTAWFAGRDTLPASYKARLRDLWRTYMPYRGDTENHWALYYSTLYLMAQEYPDDAGDRWYNGKSSRENMAEAKEYLTEWMRLATTIGQGEYDSPHYIKVYIAPMALLAAYAIDPEMRQRGRMMLEYVIADYAAESLGGYYGGAHSRIYERGVTEQWLSASPRFAWLMWGNMPFGPSGESYILAQSGYEPPYLLYQIATDRATPYAHRELKRTRHRWRNSDVRNAPVYKYTWMRPEYVLGSSQGGLLQPIQQETWSLMWTVDDPRGAHNTFFTVQPYSNPEEGTMYFAEHPDMVTELIVRSKKEYDEPTKWTGGSPYEQVAQHEDALIALYDIPKGNRFPVVNAFFSRDLTKREEDPSGWIFARGGDAYIAFFPLAGYAWEQNDAGDWRWYSGQLKNGAVVQVAPAGRYASWEGFKEAVRALPLHTATEPVPEVSFTTLAGARLHARYGEPMTVDGTPLDYAGWPLFEGPFLNADRGSQKLEICYERACRVLDFTDLTITDTVTP
ncbi:MAG: hypothetical protein R2834_01825 [Rhodothermales bacterium]